MKKRLSQKMCKSILLMVICSSNLVGGNNVYAAHIDGVGYQSNVGDTVYQQGGNKTVNFQNGDEVNGYNDNGIIGPAVQIVDTSDFKIQAGNSDDDKVTFNGGGIGAESIINTRHNAKLEIAGGTVVLNQVPIDERKDLGNRFAIRAEDDTEMLFSNKDTIVNVEFEKFQDDPYNFISLVSAEENAKITFDSKLTLNGLLKGDKKAMLIGIWSNKDAKVLANNDVNINLLIDNNKVETFYGVYAQNSSNLTFNKNLKVDLNAANTNTKFGSGVTVKGTGSKIVVKGDLDVNVKGAVTSAIFANDGGEIEIQGAANLESEGQFAVFARELNGNIGKITLNGDISINTSNTSDKYWNNYALGANGGIIDINLNGGKKVNIHGGVILSNNGMINMKLDTADSVFSGSIIDIDNSGVSTLDLSNGAQWLVSKVPQNYVTKVTNLTLSNNAVVDLTYDDSANSNISIGNFSGNDGSFVLDTDLASETNGDKIDIANASNGTTAFIQVKDISLTNGMEVTDHKNLLLAEDHSGNVTFVGKNLNNGGLWDVTPTIENGLNVTDGAGNVIGTADQWYLTKIKKSLNNDTTVLVENAHTNYALWMNLNDTLRQRLGEVREHGADSDSLWARYVGGKFDDAGYNVFQLGYDKADNEKSIYGFAVERGTASGSYSFGKEEDKLVAASLYAVWTGDDGSYTNAVAKIGQASNEIKTYGDYPDRADFKNKAYGLSLEYGKKIELGKDKRFFIEPQAQIKLSKLSGTSYTTERGTSVNTDDMNSIVGRLGIVAGRKTDNGNEFYVKASALHEFSAESNMSLQAANGEKGLLSQDYGDTWVELGLGTNIKLSKTSYFYGDIERSFGGDIEKKWQINAGLRFEF